MNKFSTYRPIVTNKLIALLKANGFYNEKAAKHGKYTRDSDDHKIMIPRARKLSPGLSKQICKDLVDLHGFNKEDIEQLF